MIICQDSPVEHLSKRRNEVVKSLKFACSFSSCMGPLIIVSPNIDLPMMANMKKRMISSTPREHSEGAESSKV
eukprot:CAMPEP_0185599898 /NCGR_PEP_ID=MMETSP0434-20130131/83018_1 /TAXON_ID=626734 ORGANISM="Favella taraikaensis, Strain Fe Narragansett Bay" /NCGR_SAMPLE_ID=MMETSP0434 /ASSEMBLY_ACC=CAM_ASM_000379 /LENGTH=72 /DNA_ID=CAMNT_0028229471 /DNA_START=1341 /DNA_END=1559 /DNA_ORIENTATION=+